MLLNLFSSFFELMASVAVITCVSCSYCWGLGGKYVLSVGPCFSVSCLCIGLDLLLKSIPSFCVSMLLVFWSLFERGLDLFSISFPSLQACTPPLPFPPRVSNVTAIFAISGGHNELWGWLPYIECDRLALPQETLHFRKLFSRHTNTFTYSRFEHLRHFNCDY